MTISKEYFHGEANINPGCPSGTGDTLADLIRKNRSGRAEAAGSGDVAVTFDVPFDDTNYTVLAVPEAASFQEIFIKTTSIATTGFTVTVEGACTVHWFARHD